MPHFDSPICNYEYKLITPPTETPVTVEQFKDKLNIAASDTSKDDLIDRLIKAATKIAEQFLNRQLVTQSWALFLDRFGIHNHHHHSDHGFHDSFFHEGITLKKRPFDSLTKVEFYPVDWNKTDARDDFDINKFFQTEATQGRDGEIILFDDETFPDTFNIRQAIRIEFIAGQVVADICPDIAEAILVIAVFMFEHPGDCSCDGGTGIPAEAKVLLHQHRVYPNCT